MEIAHRARNLLIFNLVVCFCLTVGFIVQKLIGNKAESLVFFLAHIFANTLFLGVCWLASKRNLKYIEFSGFALIGSAFIVMVLCVSTELVVKMDDKRFLQEFAFTAIYNLLYIGLFTT